MMIPDDPEVAIARATGAAFVRKCQRDGTQATVDQVGVHAWPTLIRCLALADTPPEILRAVLEEAWLMYIDRIRRSGLYGKPLLRLFRRARFDVSALPLTLTVWRGGRSTPNAPFGVAEAAQGMSWSTRKETAAYYAIQGWRGENPDGVPMVVRRTVRRAQVVYFRPDSRDMEVIADGPVEGLAIDGGPLEWFKLAETEGRRRLELSAALLAGPDCIAKRRQVQRILTRVQEAGVPLDATLTAERMVEALRRVG